MAEHREGLSLIPTRFQQAEIPISVATLLIDGKRLTSSFYKQITEADLIDEDTGELRGEPLGYFHLHSKVCPEVPHTHVLWTTGPELHLATVVSTGQDERYQKQEQTSVLKPVKAKTGKQRAEPVFPDGLDPDQVWKSHQRESDRFEDVSRQWKAHIKQLSTLRQLFLLS